MMVQRIQYLTRILQVRGDEDPGPDPGPGPDPDPDGQKWRQEETRAWRAYVESYSSNPKSVAVEIRRQSGM